MKTLFKVLKIALLCAFCFLLPIGLWLAPLLGLTASDPAARVPAALIFIMTWIEGSPGALLMVGLFLAALVFAGFALCQRERRQSRLLRGAGALFLSLGFFASRSALAASYNDDSPVSLLFGGALEDGGIHAVRFPLDLHHPRSWYTWKASAAAPLLVYDPSHAGRIASPTQLFGRWSFGGRPGGAAARPWRHGYEPLAALDADHDGCLSGAELEPLGLWFDADRDGVSRPGEVRPLTDTGVVTLFYRPDYRDPQTGELYARCGYERLVDGRKRCGASVDWLSSRGATRRELMIAERLQRVFRLSAESR